jgi:hypothetical protein
MPTRSIPWPRILAEGVAIVVSILLAFGIQAWWEGRQERVQEQEILAGLQRELQEISDVIDEDLRDTEAAQSLLRTFLAMTPDQASRIPPDSAYFTVLLPITRAYAQPRPRGFIDATVSSGKLGLIRDASLRAALSDFLARDEYTERTAANLQALSLEGQKVLGRRPEVAPILGTAGQGGAPIRAETLRALRSDPDLGGVAGAKMTSWTVYQVLLGGLQRRLDALLVLLQD